MGLLHLAIVLGCAALISAQITIKQLCPEVKTQQNFDVDKYVGSWYEIKKITNNFQAQGKCDTARYNKLENGTVEVINRMCLYNNPIRIVGNAKGAPADIKQGKLNVNFPIMGNHESPYHVLGTDYEHYSVVWSCEETGTGQDAQSIRFLWVLGRDATLSKEHSETIDKIITDAGLNDELKALKDTDHKDCCYIANKKCPDVQTKQDFDVDKYVGSWYEIKKIPNNYQAQGKCDTARYNKLENGTAEVVNRMCLYNNPIRIVGNAKEESKDSIKQGKLSVNFPIMGNHESPYHVLGTDYEHYSVVWSCEELGPESNAQSRYLWVLGRGATLSKEHSATVEKIIKDAGLSEEFKLLKDTDHKDCCYDETKDEGDGAASIGLSVALLLSTVMVRFL